jgi:hypothetical protein
VGHVIRYSHRGSSQDCGRDLLQGTEGLSHHLMGLPDFERSAYLTFDAGQVSMRFVWFRLFEICVLKFGSGFGNWELEV